ncbi:methionine--tRNA ligase [Halomicroarcula sp. F28]|uniref:methionine--tRNA ligase n=1 Tax=Haloarcula salinisoli TaxID=2487746 RepID=UPI001C72FFE2|nr:methionine--tRNA ligase [Halomicroarcula salinisoli]MBX0286166.1 methionine--tRNA ligase [Halomicroarcula salinisoli]
MSHDDFPTDHPAVVTCGLPYANGDLHVGHLRTYVAGDALSRGLRRIGQQTAFVCGSDMHGTPVAVNAAEEGVEPREFALDYHDTYAETFPQFNVEFDNYGHTDDETNTELTQEFVRSWVDEGHVHEKEIEVAWDTEEDQPLPDRFVEGTCPYCGEQARGDECDEGCQRHLEPGDIEDPVSTITGNPAEYRTREHKFLRLADFQEYLQGFLDRIEGTDNAKNQPREWVEGELQDLCITRDMDWGIDYPAGGDEGEDTAEDLVLYVWVDAPIEYVASTKQYSERVGADEYDWEQVWKIDGETEDGTEWDDDWTDESGDVVHVIGRDIIQHHAVFWPAMLRGAGYNEPRSILATGFVGIDGKALSTSRNRAVWADEYLDAGFHPDLFRYYIATGAGLETDVDFSWDRFAERVNGELVGNVGNFINRALLFAARNYDGTPDAAISEDVRDRIEETLESFETAVRDYDVRTLAELATELSDYGNEYIQRTEPWHLLDEDPSEAAQVIRDCVQLAKAVAVVMQPVLPGKAERLWGQLGEAGSVADVSLDTALEAPPETFDEPDQLFEQVEDDHIAELNEELQDRVEEASDDGDDADEADVDLEPLETDRIGFEDFEGVDMRVGEIVTAESVEDADKLLKLEVDIGHEVRQVVAGLAELHDVDELPGTRVILLANMEQATIFGVESNGMVLAAGDEADLLTTHEDAPLGTRVQ